MARIGLQRHKNKCVITSNKKETVMMKLKDKILDFGLS
jgi:hypothetical protein